MFSQLGGKASNAAWPPSPELHFQRSTALNPASRPSDETSSQLNALLQTVRKQHADLSRRRAEPSGEASSQLGALLQTVRKQHADLRRQMGEVSSPSSGPSMPSPSTTNVLQTARVPHTAPAPYPPSAHDAHHRKLALEQTPPATPERVLTGALAQTASGSVGLVEPPWPSQPIFVTSRPQPEPEPEQDSQAESQLNRSEHDGGSFGGISTRAYFDPYSRENISYHDADRSASPARVGEAWQHRPQALSPARERDANAQPDKPRDRPCGRQQGEDLPEIAPRSPPPMDLDTIGRLSAVLAGLEEQTLDHLKAIRCLQHWVACSTLVHATACYSGLAGYSAGGFRSSSGEQETEAATQQHWDEEHSRGVSNKAQQALAAAANGVQTGTGLQCGTDGARANVFAGAAVSARLRVHGAVPADADDEADDVSTLLAAAADHVARSEQVVAEGDAAWRAAAALLCRQIEESMGSSGATSFEASSIGISSTYVSG